MISQSALRGVRCVVSGLLLAAGAMAFDSAADPVLSDQDAGSTGVTGSEDGRQPQDDSSREETPPVAIDSRLLPALKFGEIRFDTGVSALTLGDPDNKDTANLSHAQSGWNLRLGNPPSPSAGGEDAAHPHATSSVAAWLEAAPAVTPEQDAGLAGTTESAYEDPKWGSITTVPEGRDFLTHPLTILVALIIPGVWLFAKLLDRIERLRTIESRSRRRRRRGGRRRSRRA